ncbi:hypothetical protein KP509_20G024100 [Ceratopteris richardii]|uniref:Uncharacterized protein n=1 Tax=Ceratopteris richardii TaxID=49495 RepID=A0A8T2SEH2_CERRI|nr:hypothetical protein KP509_20G024100 [Ceratopteris richardii]
MPRMQLIALLGLFSACVLLASGQGVAAVNVTFELDKLVNFGEGSLQAMSMSLAIGIQRKLLS